MLCCVCLLLPGTVLLLAAAPPERDTPEELVRRANVAFRAGDKDTADQLYAAAEERTGDPGLVAFNRATILFERGAYREAELHYERVLRDAACPAERAAKAWYNRGTCLLRRGGSWEVYRSAIACFEHTLDSPVADEPLKADTRFNLEIAKLRAIEEHKKEENKDKSYNDTPPPEEQQPDKRPNTVDQEPGTTPDTGTNAKTNTKQKNPDTTTKQTTNNTQTKDNGNNTAGNNTNIEVVQDTDQVQQLSEKDARLNLQETAKRIKREQQSLLRSLYGADRVGVRDW
jgi:tetratricopeptide (TPR) repeat protein